MGLEGTATSFKLRLRFWLGGLALSGVLQSLAGCNTGDRAAMPPGHFAEIPAEDDSVESSQHGDEDREVERHPGLNERHPGLR